MEPQGPPSGGWGAIGGGGRFDGWPLRLHAARLSLASTSTFLISTPSATSFSSSEFDTESTGSFFPEKSTTLGSLIGFRSSSQLALENMSAMETEQEKKPSISGNSRSRTWWSLLDCRGGSLHDTSDMPPSPTDFITKERQETVSSQSTGEHQSHGGRVPVQEIASDRSIPYDIEQETLVNPSNHPTLRKCGAAALGEATPSGPASAAVAKQPWPAKNLTLERVYVDLSECASSYCPNHTISHGI